MSNTNKLPLFPIVIVALGIVLIISAGVWLLKTPVTSPPVTPTAQQNVISEADIPRVSLADAKAALDSGRAIFVDVRSLAAYAQSRIPGALSIPENEIASHLNELKRTDWIITYCT